MVSDFMVVGKTLRSRYQIKQHLGSGGFGNTYLAQDLDLPGNPDCVVKHLLPKNSNTQILTVARKLFNREAECLHSLGSNGQIPTLYAYFEEEGEFYLVEELIAGFDLSTEIVPGNSLSEGQTIKLLQEILAVLATVHASGMIHRDLKPSNIMRRQGDGKLVLIDFGAVKASVAGNNSLTVAVGSPGYMPYEQSQGQPVFASDVYAVGMIAIQALSGITPQKLLDGETGVVNWQSHVNVSQALASVLNKMVARAANERYQDAASALEAVKGVKNIRISQVTTILSPQVQTILSAATQPMTRVKSEKAVCVAREPIESQCYQEVVQPGALIRIKAPQKMGKTWLLSKILDYGEKQGYRVAKLDFRLAESEVLRDYQTFLQWFCVEVSESLEIEEQIESFWKRIYGLNKNCDRYFSRYVLKEVTTPIILGLDNFERLFNCETIFEDFCSLLRSWHEKTKSNGKKKSGKTYAY